MLDSLRRFGRAVLLLVMCGGVALTVAAGLRYRSAAVTLETIHAQAADIERLTPDAQVAYLLELSPQLLAEYRAARATQASSWLAGGVGLVLLGVGWLGYDRLHPTKNRSA